ncbi:hypothetical protein DRJ25_05670 [Candidatus Woesearchaeota archaeon]|nr:MAG: hypothetical protein DRJ25_05670 [Candidatus Woesearchaeota archaeon]
MELRQVLEGQRILLPPREGQILQVLPVQGQEVPLDGPQPAQEALMAQGGLYGHGAVQTYEGLQDQAEEEAIEMARRKKTMFFPPRHKKIAAIISIEDPKKARKAVKTLLRRAKKTNRRKTKVLIKRCMILAANRAEASAKRRNITKKEKRELRTVANIYRRAAREIEL